jgi:hypothetical protein
MRSKKSCMAFSAWRRWILLNKTLELFSIDIGWMSCKVQVIEYKSFVVMTSIQIASIPEHQAIAVFTGKSVESIKSVGGSESWVLDRNKAIHREFLVCCRSGVSWAEGNEVQGSAFLVGRIEDIVPSNETAGRWMIKLSEFAFVAVPGVWKGWRNPVSYGSLRSFGIAYDTLNFQPMPDASIEKPVASVLKKMLVKPLTIKEAKQGLAQHFQVAEESIEIVIRG